jgi:hypothetical protein
MARGPESQRLPGSRSLPQRGNLCWRTSASVWRPHWPKRGRHRRVRTSPRLPLGATALRVPRSEMSKEAATNGRWQRRFPPVPCRSEQSRQGAERKNDGSHVWFQRWAQIVSTKTYLRTCCALPRPYQPRCYPENSDPICCLLAYALPVASGIHAPRLLNKRIHSCPTRSSLWQEHSACFV